MAAYNFQKQFAPAIVRRKNPKCSTIRARRKNGYVPEVGERIKLYSGMRSKSCLLLKQVVVKRVRPIFIDTEDGQCKVAIDGIALNGEETARLAIDDGFNGILEFRAFFNTMHGTQSHLYLIEW